MEYQVPQFIEVEDKIFGPLTFKQFIYVAGGVGMSVGLILYLHVIGFIIALPIAALSGALAFYKLNNKTFAEIMEASFNYYIGGRLYLWKKDPAPKVVTPEAAVPVSREKLSLSRNKLHDLAWSLDIRDQNPQNEAETTP